MKKGILFLLAWHCFAYAAAQKLIKFFCGTQHSGPFEAESHDPKQFALMLARSKDHYTQYKCHTVGLYRRIYKNNRLEEELEKSYGSTLSFLTDTLDFKELSLEEHFNLARAYYQTPSAIENGYQEAEKHCLAILSEIKDNDLDEKVYAQFLIRAESILSALYHKGGHGINAQKERAHEYKNRARARLEKAVTGDENRDLDSDFD